MRLRGVLSILGLICLAACAGEILPGEPDPGDNGGGGGGGGGGDPLPSDRVTVELVAGAAAGVQRVNFALPLPAGAAADERGIRVAVAGGNELPAYRRGLARYPDGSLRSVQLQVDVDVDAVTALEVTVTDQPATDSLDPVAVADTLDGDRPGVFALLPADWLAASGVAGPAIPDDRATGVAAGAWSQICDYTAWSTDVFMGQMADKGPWLYDRVTAHYRGYVRTGDLEPLTSGYREAVLYESGISGAGASTRIGIPDAAGDLKYHYSQGLAIHYLLTGDDRFRERAEDIATRASELWTSPGYAGGADFWTERHAGFGLLAYVWAAAVSDDRADDFIRLADDAVAAYREVQETFPAGYDDPDARCFAHTAEAHSEPYGYVGCSPWMSAILADGLDAYARLRAGTAEADDAITGIVKLGRAIAEGGRDADGKPYYWMGVGTDQGEVDPYDEHWGEPAYVVAMAWHLGGRTDDALRAVADQLVGQLAERGEVGQVRSFNWQCRSAPMAPYFLAP